MPRLWAMSMDTEASLKQYLSLQLKLPLVARIGPLARHVRLRGHGRAGRQGDRDRRQAVLGGQGDATTTSSWSTPPPTGHIVGQLAAPQAINQLVQVGLVRQQTGWMLDILGDPRRPALVIVATPGGDAGQRDDRPAGPDREPRPRRPGRASSSTGCCPSCSAGARRTSSIGWTSPTRSRSSTSSSAGRSRPIIDGARLAVTLRRTRTAHLERLRAASRRVVPLLYVPVSVRPLPRTALDPADRRGPLGRAGLLRPSDRARRRHRPVERGTTPWMRWWRPRRS